MSKEAILTARDIDQELKGLYWKRALELIPAHYDLNLKGDTYMEVAIPKTDAYIAISAFGHTSVFKAEVHELEFIGKQDQILKEREFNKLYDLICHLDRVIQTAEDNAATHALPPSDFKPISEGTPHLTGSNELKKEVGKHDRS